MLIMSTKAIECLLVTANCGSVFEDPSRLLENWISVFLSHVERCKPDFIALHLQEVGGKTYEKSMEYVQQFIKILCESQELSEYNKIRVFLDEDYNSAEHFTALGNLYFAHNSVRNIRIWNFLTHEFEDVDGKQINTGNIESIATKEKAKFPQHFFPECKWSRKGFMRTRWNIEGSTFDLINIHLFHDASNLAACEQFPSVYCKSRRRALIHTLERFHKDQVNVLVPFFIFGDFNFRCDTEGVIKKLTTDLIEQRIPHLKNDHLKVQYRDNEGCIKLTVGKKEFTHIDHQIFKQDWLRQFDRELEPLHDILHEFPIEFPPSYPFEEDPELPHHYMSTRCPAWCDRILMTKAAKKIMDNEENFQYGIIGTDVCMGDHKPVYLKLCLRANQGIVNYCDHAQARLEGCKENNIFVKELNSRKLLSYCDMCLKHLNAIVDNDNRTLPLTTQDNNNRMPLVSISVVDADNLNICMCNNNDDMQAENENICPNCRHLIKQQPSERCMLVSKKVVILGDVVVNRIDSQYLTSTYSTSPSVIRMLTDPYTPESVESHSPQPEIDEREFPNFINKTSDCDDIIENMREVIKQKHNGDVNDETDKIGNLSNHFNHTVSPSQLTTRLEILRRESQLDCYSKKSGSGSSDSSKKVSQRCFSCKCVIL